jgi:cyanate lyase
MNDAKALLGQQIISQKSARKLTWAEIAAAIGQAPVWTCAACLGQMSMPADIAQKIVELLGLPAEAAATLAAIPYRGALPTAVPTDPLIYRFYELINVYGTTWKEIIQEEFGDGIMSAIDFDMAIERQPDPKGDRVKMTLSGKFLPYKRY